MDGFKCFTIPTIEFSFFHGLLKEELIVLYFLNFLNFLNLGMACRSSPPSNHIQGASVPPLFYAQDWVSYFCVCLIDY